ncbi:MAG: ATP-binding protein [Cyclobacteriaceae bacterium]
MIVLVGGLPGSGKTYFASRLAKRIKAQCISSDKVRKTLHALGKHSLEDKLAVYKELVIMASSELKLSRIVVIDATFSHRDMRTILVELAKSLSQPLCLLWIYAAEDLIKKRIAGPRENSEADFKVYEKIRDQFQPIDIPHLTIESRDNNIEDMLKQGEDYILNYERT